LTRNPSEPKQAYVIIAGFGVPGRSVAESLEAGEVSFTVIERNPATVLRCQRGPMHVIAGDARDTDVLRRAGIDRATVLAITIPDDLAVLDVIEQARRLNPSVRIIARCSFISGGFEATRRGADEVVVAEKTVADEFRRIVAEEARR
jgi:CPA2 family monovalent cation:H+ antiporter-2